MPRLRFSIDIPAERLQAYYGGRANQVQVVSDDGRQVRFPAIELRRFVTGDGVRGRFEISFDEQYKLQSLTRID